VASAAEECRGEGLRRAVAASLMIMVFHTEEFVMAAKSGTYTIDDPDAIVEGKTIAQWTQDWWTWEIQSPANKNAVDDQTGQYANVGNDQPGVFFIGGTLGGDATRTFTVPQGDALLVPMINYFDTVDPKHLENQLVKNFRAGVTDLSATIDGNPIANLKQYLETSDFFSMGTVRPNTVATELFGNGVIGLELTPTKATGYYLMIEGLSPGQHTLEFGGSAQGFFGTVDASGSPTFASVSTHVVDHITVV
jgi:hypothetical protein